MPPAHPDKALVATRFSNRATTYDDVTPVQTQLRQALAAQIGSHAFSQNPVDILELGCGTGSLTQWLHRTHPEARITALDLAPDMVAAAKRRCPGVQAVVADAEEYVQQAQGPWDLICSSATVQWFSQPGETLQRCRKLLRPGGLLAISTFGDATFHELRDAFAAVEPDGGRVLPLPSTSSWRTLFPDADMQESFIVQTFPDVRAFLASVQLAGANSASKGSTRPLRRSVYAAMLREYESRFAAPSGGITATYHLITFCVGAAS
jgi:malonyl-CoA O-methyltransferase